MLSVDWGRSGTPSSVAARRIGSPRPRPDLIALVSVAVLVGLGLLNLQALGDRSLTNHQSAVIVAGLVLFLVVRRWGVASLRWLGRICYGLSIMLLLAVAVIGDIGYGARRWLTFGSFTLQPSELAKVGVLLVLAQALSTSRPWWRQLGVALGIAAVPIGLIAAEPDLSTATVLAALTVAMLVLGRLPLRVIAAIVATVAVTAPFAERLLHPYQVDRLHAYLSGSRSASGPGWTIMQAHIALAWGGHDGQSHQPMHTLLAEYLPERETDLAFASLVEQWGLRAGILAILAAAALVWRIAVASRHARTRGAGLFAAGLAVLIGIEVVVSVAANLGLVPTAGVPFPLVSYGGTAATVHIVAIGMVLALRADAERHYLWLPPMWRRSHPRLVRLTAVIVIAALVGMIGFALNLQRTRGPALREAGLTQMTRCISIPAPRGTITDRHGVPLAVNLPEDQVWAIRGMIGPSALSRLATLTGRPRSELRHLLNADEQAITVKLMTLSTAAGNRLSAAHLHGVLVVPSAHRRYPYGALLGPLLGWSGVASSEDMKRWPDVSLGEIVGRAGLEQQYDPILRGVDGQQCMYVDPPGVPVALGAITPPVPGANVRLTIDLGLQKRLDADLTNALSGGEQGATVALDPRNGQVLAMASRPSYDDNVFGPPVDDAALSRLDNASGNPMLQHATQVAAPAASTFKLVVAAADMVHRAVPPDDVIQTGSTFQLDGHTFHNWTDLPPQDLNQAIAWSNDVYFYRLAWALGAQSIISTAQQLGVGQPTGIDLPGESAGYLGTPSSVVASGAKWYSGSTVLLGIGQGYLTVTPLQDARWTAGLATGALVTPHLGLSFGGGRRADTGLSWPAPRRLPFAAQLGPVRTGMRTAVTSGTATVLRSLPVAAGGKTGTAEDPSAGGAGLDSWLSAVAPMDHPTIALTAFIRGTGNSHPSNEIVRSAMAYFFTHERATLAR